MSSKTLKSLFCTAVVAACGFATPAKAQEMGSHMEYVPGGYQPPTCVATYTPRNVEVSRDPRVPNLFEVNANQTCTNWGVQRHRRDRVIIIERDNDPRYADPRYNDPRYADPRYEDPRYVDPRDVPPEKPCRRVICINKPSR